MKKRLTYEEIGILFGNLGVMLHSGADLSNSLEMIAGEKEGPLSLASDELFQFMNDGKSFSEAVRLSEIFPEYAKGVIEASGYSGRLEEALLDLSQYYEKQYALRKKVQGALIYPVILMLLMCAVLLILVFFVLPMFINVYEGMTGGLLASSFRYIKASDITGKTGTAIAVIASLFLIVISIMAGNEKGRKKVYRLSEKLFFTKDVAFSLSLSKAASVIATLLRSGATEETALIKALSVTENRRLRDWTIEASEKVKNGASLSSVFAELNELPVTMRRMIMGSDISGNLPETMAKISEMLASDSHEKINSIIDVIEPVLIGFLTLTVGITLLSVMLPLIGILGAF
ncbi:MAG: type II secretion system F family protein [Clostridia bacterium]|nr:type II secretion system F family protein [Clostridia bacterium]